MMTEPCTSRRLRSPCSQLSVRRLTNEPRKPRCPNCLRSYRLFLMAWDFSASESWATHTETAISLAHRPESCDNVRGSLTSLPGAYSGSLASLQGQAVPVSTGVHRDHQPSRSPARAFMLHCDESAAGA